MLGKGPTVSGPEASVVVSNNKSDEEKLLNGHIHDIAGISAHPNRSRTSPWTYSEATVVGAAAEKPALCGNPGYFLNTTVISGSKKNLGFEEDRELGKDRDKDL